MWVQAYIEFKFTGGSISRPRTPNLLICVSQYQHIIARPATTPRYEHPSRSLPQAKAGDTNTLYHICCNAFETSKMLSCSNRLFSPQASLDKFGTYQSGLYFNQSTSPTHLSVILHEKRLEQQKSI
ncbi:MAG: hypothetical protein FE78DRAFT_32842 [Acidomyces sp. 'richmondensis']|nr:MAG: hypothetical protein FE78DRAFT_32842 [Acidomyces sp. 'richmondensis']